MLTKIWNNRNSRIREIDRYVCLTDLAKASGKSLGHWLELKGTSEYLQGFSSVIGIPIAELVEVMIM